MRVITSLIWMTATLYPLLCADDGVHPNSMTPNDPSILMQTTTFTPSHPECNQAPRITDVIPAKPVAVPVPVEKPVIIATAAPVVALDTDHDGVIDSIDECPNTPKGYKVDPKGCPSSITLHINFPFASNVLPTSANNDIDVLHTFLQENPASTITIIGHTDNIGTKQNNQIRSEARAKALATRLIEMGIETNRITTQGKGLSQPIASNKTKAGQAQNRRINIQIR